MKEVLPHRFPSDNTLVNLGLEFERKVTQFKTVFTNMMFVKDLDVKFDDLQNAVQSLKGTEFESGSEMEFTELKSLQRYFKEQKDLLIEEFYRLLRMKASFEAQMEVLETIVFEMREIKLDSWSVSDTIMDFFHQNEEILNSKRMTVAIPFPKK